MFSTFYKLPTFHWVGALTLAILILLPGCGGSGGSGGGGNNPPAAPTNLTATGGNAQVALQWTASSGATSYNVKRGTASGGPYTTVASPTGTSYTDSSVTNGTTYYYVVTAVNTSGESGNSNQASGTPNVALAAPTNLTATPGNQQIGMSWTASAGATSYNVKRGTKNGGPYSTVASPTTSSYTDTGLTNGTAYYYVVTALNGTTESGNSNQATATPSGTTTNVNVTVDILANRHTISPYVYGGAFPQDAATIADSGLPVVRWGGNGASTYNWKLGTSNADNDYYFEDFAFGVLNNAADSDSSQFIKDVKAAGSIPLMTMVMLPWVAQSAETSVTQGGTNNYHWVFSVSQDNACASKVDQYNTDAGINLQSDCKTAMVASPTQLNRAYYPLLDGPPKAGDPANSVYRNQWAAAMATAYGSGSCPIPYTSITSCHFYDMDNEIDIWGGTHVDVHPNPTTYPELRDIYLKEATNLKGWDAQAVRMGWVSCCWYFYWNSAAGDKSNFANIDFMPWWLNEVAWRDAVNGARTLDIFDLHAYPETSTNGLTQTQARALVLRSTRDWWDPSYTSEAWFGTNSVTSQEPFDGKAFRIPRARAWANTIYPGTPLAFTEWNFQLSNDSDFSTALADADAYGILGRERVSLSTRWTTPTPTNPNYQALKLYTNYDGAHHGFAPISVSATNNADPGLFSSYGALSADGKTLHVIIVNKDPSNTASVNFQFPSNATPTSVKTYTLSSSNPTQIVSATPSFTSTMNFSPYSATLLVMSIASQPPASEWDLNPDTIFVPAGGTATLQPKLTSGSATVTLSSPTSDTGITVAVTQSAVSTGANGLVTVTAGNTPGFYHYNVTGTDSSAAQTQGGWIIVGNPAATLTKTGDNQTGGSLTLTATLAPGSSGGTATGATIFFTTDKGSLSQRLVTTDSSGKASVTLTLPSGTGTAHVTAEGPYGLGHPLATFTESN